MSNGDTNQTQSSDLRNRIFFTIFILSIYRLGTYVPLAGIDPVALTEIMSSVKGQYLEKIFISSTMGPSIIIDHLAIG